MIRRQIRDFCHHASSVQGSLPRLDYEVHAKTKQLSISCRNFKDGICHVLWTPCPINLSPEVHVVSNEALLRFPKTEIPSVESDVVSAEEFLRAQEAFLINPDKSGKFLFDDQAQACYDHLIIQARDLV